MNLVLIVFAYLCCRSIARVQLPCFIFDMFLEKTKLKDDSSNDADWVSDLRIILIAAQKNYVLDAPLGDEPVAGADADIMNVLQARYDDYLIVQCAMLNGLEPRLQKRFERHRAYKMFQELKLVFQTHARVKRYETSDKVLCLQDGGEQLSQ